MNLNKIKTTAIFLLVSVTFSAWAENTSQITHIYIASDSTAADHTLNDDYWENRHPVTGWAQKLEPLVNGENLKALAPLIDAEKVQVINRARGGRSTRTFFEEGRWRRVYRDLNPGDLVLIQFGHNDAAVEKTERYVTPEGYREYLRLFIAQTRERGAYPILMTPVARNYPWEDGKLINNHGEYTIAVKEIALETGTPWIDLLARSKAFFTDKGKDYTSANYFMNLPAGEFPAYPDGQDDNTHFQPEGAEEVAKLVYRGLVDIAQTH
ncbi:rhamnogalacturonan acetylesterase [Gilvimarinus sp. DA14]|uniref:rhamnogalacturonan acetylesterase n=1 Tax=Gilvimarinus sp. DA14 TaxID=2956798 RepID=UPI0020B7FCC5|nr:rhamnogalacturonan acetylesterase [Gilvimarinus sp. DA14]UTF59476.1 rhamnogalacturonan acetylesterase [Gilvimarinus sp. DA14]